MSEWTEARRGVPAEEMDILPDTATTWACWVRLDQAESVTVYHDDGEFYTTWSQDEEISVEEDGVDEETALATSEDIRTGSGVFGEDHPGSGGGTAGGNAGDEMGTGEGDDMVRVQGSTLEALTKFAHQNRPRDGTGWIGETANAVIEAETTLFDDQIVVERAPLETVYEWVSHDSALDLADHDDPVKRSLREVEGALGKFSADVGKVSAPREDVVRVLEFVKDDSALDSAPKDADILAAIRHLSNDVDHDDPYSGPWERGADSE